MIFISRIKKTRNVASRNGRVVVSDKMALTPAQIARGVVEMAKPCIYIAFPQNSASGRDGGVGRRRCPCGAVVERARYMMWFTYQPPRFYLDAGSNPAGSMLHTLLCQHHVSPILFFLFFSTTLLSIYITNSHWTPQNHTSLTDISFLSEPLALHQSSKPSIQL